MKYMLLIYGDEGAMASASEAEMKAGAAEYEVFTKSITESGNFLDGDPFHATGEAKTVQVRDGRSSTADGPAVKGTPQLMAYYKVQADNLDQAVEMATRIPGARYGSIEVRPVVLFD